MSTISITKLYDLLSAKVGKETAENLTTFIEDKIKKDLESKTHHLATKEDLAKVEGTLMKWMFIYWAGQLVAIFSFILLYFKK